VREEGKRSGGEGGLVARDVYELGLGGAKLFWNGFQMAEAKTQGGGVTGSLFLWGVAFFGWKCGRDRAVVGWIGTRGRERASAGQAIRSHSALLLCGGLPGAPGCREVPSRLFLRQLRPEQPGLFLLNRPENR
jgi:hypothetical protein